MTIRTEQRAAHIWDDDGGLPPSNISESPSSDHPDNYVSKTFQIPELKGISTRNIQEHLELYKGYVKFSNHILNRIRELPKDEAHAYELALLQRRFAFEYDGMKYHEAFFEQFEGGPGACVQDGPFLNQAAKDFGTLEALVDCLKGIALTRGVGWVMLYSDPESGHLIPHWVDEHHIGVLSGLRLILTLDMWEHAYLCDYAATERKDYVEAFFQNLSWIKVEARFGK
jgi:superoxide dismutase, Fe-Mn family